MVDQFVFKTLEKYLNAGDVSSKDSASFFCPFCNHRKKKLNIQLNHNSENFGNWHCWVCNAGGLYVHTLLKKIGVNNEIVKSVKKYIEVELLKTCYGNENESQLKNTLILPKEFISLSQKNNTPDFKNAIYYLKKRKIGIFDIVRYNIGYCETGLYKQRIVIPSYDEKGFLNFFSARSYINDESKKYMGAEVEKDFIGFELFINWNEPITLLEGAFDAIAFRRNAIPLFGTIIPNKLRLKIIQKSVKDLYICLDNDAIKKSLIYIEEFMKQGINLYLVPLNEKDPADSGYEKLVYSSYNCKKIKFSDLMKLKLSTK